MAKNNFYAVKRGHKVGIFKSWPECQAAINGYSNPEFKGFITEEEALAFMNGVDIYKKQIEDDLANGYVVAYTDGSYDEGTNQYAFGVCIFDRNGNEVNLCNNGSFDPFLPSRNIAGEIYGVLTALDWAMSNGHEKVRIYHDLEHIGKWATGEFKAESELSKYFVGQLEKKYNGIINYEFIKVPGHSNNPYNEKADQLSSSALKGEKKMIKGANSFSVSNFRKEDLEAIIQLVKEGTPDAKDERNSILGGEQIKLSIGNKSTVIKMYDNKKLLVQGKQNVAYQVILTYISELLGEQKIVPLIKQAFRIKVDTKTIESNYSNLCPNIPETYNQNIKTLIRQAIINLNGYFESEEYGQYAYPALRALEGHIKVLFGKHNITVGRMFDQFDGDPMTGYRLKPTYVFPTPYKTNIEMCYNYYNQTRHKIFHYGDLMGQADNTHMVTTKTQADEIIREVLKHINNTAY